jgi:hypothetical protein
MRVEAGQAQWQSDCSFCNQYKAEWAPSPEENPNLRVLHPLRDNAAIHIRPNPEQGLLEPLTETGVFHIALLRLNRPQLVQHCRRVHLDALRQRRLIHLEAENDYLKARLTSQESDLAFFESHVKGLPSLDAT